MKTMKEVFNGKPCGFSTRMTDEQVRHGQHAINCHDELVAMLERVSQGYKNMIELNIVNAMYLNDIDQAASEVDDLLSKARGKS